MLLLTVAATALIFLYRFAGFSLKVDPDSSVWERILRLVPVSVFAALVVSSLYSSPESSSIKFIALACAGAMCWRTKQAGLSILLGLAILWLLVIAG